VIRYDVRTGVRKIKTKTAAAITGTVMVGATLLMAVAMPLAAHAANTTIYNNIPSPAAGNYPSVGYEATSTSEYGGQVSFDGTARENPTVTVLMSSWGCESGGWNTGDCVTTPGATFSEPITLNVYNVGPGGSIGSLVTSKTATFNIQYRPSADTTHCTGGTWYSATDNTCYNGYATPISFNLSGVTLPDNVIISVAYNTTHYGYSPIGESAACYHESGGCGYDSLNVAVAYPPSLGTVSNPSDEYLNSSWAGAYCDSGSGGTGTFRIDHGCLSPDQPMFKVEAGIAMPTTKDQCMNNGWKSYGSTFKNQGDCVSFVATNGKNQPSGPAKH